MSIITKAQEIRSLFEAGKTRKEIELSLKVYPSQISSALKGMTTTKVVLKTKTPKEPKRTAKQKKVDLFDENVNKACRLYDRGDQYGFTRLCGPNIWEKVSKYVRNCERSEQSYLEARYGRDWGMNYDSRDNWYSYTYEAVEKFVKKFKTV